VIEAAMIDLRSKSSEEATLICSELPSLHDFKCLYLTDIREVHFVGELDKPDSVEFLNKLSKACPEDGFKVVQLSTEK
jgi:hypothetical protein